MIIILRFFEDMKISDIAIILNYNKGKTLYNDFKNEIEQIKEGHKSLNSFYKIKTNNENILYVGIHIVKSQASIDEKVKYYNYR